MNFSKFSSLENVSNQRAMFAVLEQGISGPWVVTEKIDGANFCFYTDGDRVWVASRTQFVDGSFFNCQDVIDRYSDAIKQFHASGGQKGILRVYGELFGPKINGRINYGNRDFVAFDLVFVPEGSDTEVHCNKLVAQDLCKWFDIPFVPLLGVYERFDDALQHTVTFRSNLTPEGHEGNNFAEGVVIEPMHAQFFANGKRVYFKNRAPEFMEIAHVKRDVPKEAVVLPEQVQKLLEDISCYLTENRVYNVASKIGELGEKDFGKLLSLVVADAREDYEKDNDVAILDIVGSAEKTLAKTLAKAATIPVRKVFLELRAA